jgi:hypothetical protein
MTLDALIYDDVIPFSPPFADVRTAIGQVLVGSGPLLAWVAGGNPWSKSFTLKVYEFGAPVDIQDVEVRIQDGGIVPQDDWNSRCQWFIARFFVWVMYTAANTDLAESMLREIQGVLSGIGLIRTTGVSGRQVCVQDVRYLGPVEPVPQLEGWGVAGLYRARVSSLT